MMPPTIMLIEGDTAHVARYRGYDQYIMADMLLNLQFSLESTATLREMIATRQPLAVPDTNKYPGWLKIAKMEWLRSYISVPLISDGKVRGFLNLSSVTPGYFTAQDTVRLQPFAVQATIAIRNAQLYSEARKMAGDQADS
jgi:GAF domain-containing protein